MPLPIFLPPFPPPIPGHCLSALKFSHLSPCVQLFARRGNPKAQFPRWFLVHWIPQLAAAIWSPPSPLPAWLQKLGRAPAPVLLPRWPGQVHTAHLLVTSQPLRWLSLGSAHHLPCQGHPAPRDQLKWPPLQSSPVPLWAPLTSLLNSFPC